MFRVKILSSRTVAEHTGIVGGALRRHSTVCLSIDFTTESVSVTQRINIPLTNSTVFVEAGLLR